MHYPVEGHFLSKLAAGDGGVAADRAGVGPRRRYVLIAVHLSCLSCFSPDFLNYDIIFKF
jgi:hypothetical protein